MFDGKCKAVTFSFDDGVLQDARLIKLFEKYNLKGTFNINSARLGEKGELPCRGITVDHSRFGAEELRGVYDGHEVAAHTLTHPYLIKIEDDEEVVRQVEEDRLRLSELMGYEVVGFAYPGGGPNCDDRLVNLVKGRTGAKYARTVGVTNGFAFPADLFAFQATTSDGQENNLELAEAFLKEPADAEHVKVFYLYGHSYSFDADPDSWKRMEAICEMISNRADIFYGTNKEILLP